MGVVISNIGARMDFGVAIESLKRQNVVFTMDQLSQSYLRTEVVLDPNTSRYSFPVKVNTTAPGQTTSPTMRLLKSEDAFYAADMAFWIEAHTIPGAIPDLYRYRPFTYPSESLNRTGTVLSKLGYKLWAGEMTLSVNGKQIVPIWDLKRHLYVPDRQVSAENGPFPVSQFYYDHDQFDGASTAFFPVEPNTVLLGNKGIELTVNYPENINNAIGSPEDGFVTKLVIVYHGILAQNVSKTA